ncbi:MAG: hypothetical protein ACR2PR_05815 [Pseudohongiellaceae bacterium]
MAQRPQSAAFLRNLEVSDAETPTQEPDQDGQATAADTTTANAGDSTESGATESDSAGREASSDDSAPSSESGAA